jgi:two-component system chemotaxis response regulator CheB
VNKLRVAIIDDSAVCREALAHILEEDGDIEITGEASDGTGALGMMKTAAPQLVTVDIDMPNMGGLATVTEIMAHCPVPILIVTGRPAERRTTTLFEAVQRGALDLAEKPSHGQGAQCQALRSLVRSLAKVPVIRHVAGKHLTASAVARVQARAPRQRLPLRIVGIGASAGGPAAVAHVLHALPRDLRVPIVVVQHILPGFAAAFAQFLRDQGTLPIEVVTGPVVPRPGTVFLASDDRHVVAGPRGVLFSNDDGPYQGHRPSVTVLFRSLAGSFQSSAMGVILSGMGDDGVAGLTEMRALGSLTVAQSRETSAVYGMPCAALDSGAAEVALSPAEIAHAIVHATAGSLS